MINEVSSIKSDLTQTLNPLQEDYVNINSKSLTYEAHPNIEGQCLLSKIVPIRKSTIRFLIFVTFSIVFVGIPLLLTFWYPKLKKKWYYIQVTLKEATHFYIQNNDGHPTYPIKQFGQHYFNENQSRELIYFYNRYLKYIIIQGNIVKAAHLNFLPQLQKIQKQGSRGLTQEVIPSLRKSFGVGTMILQQKTITFLFISQIMRPMYLFIVLSCVLWFYENYLYYSIMIAVTAAFGIGTSLIQTYRINKKIYEMAYFETEVNILRNGRIERISSKNVVPGDVVFIKQAMKMPFDCLLLHGSALSNQCSITGQSVPILKKAEHIKLISDIKNSYIYEGSFLIQVNSKQKFKQSLQIFQKFRQQYGVPVYVIRTNFITMKGQLIRIISFPVERENIFEKQSVKFLLFLFGLAVISYILLVIKLSEVAQIQDLIVKFFDLITVTVPPGLPVSMTFGIVFALEKMKEKSIFCTSPNKTIVGGMTNFLCFDKTGTLTEDFMDFDALLPSISTLNNPRFLQPINKNNEQNIQQIIKKHPFINFALNNMAVNHTIVKLEATGENVGDPMQVKMFEFGEFDLCDHTIHDQEVLEEYKSNRGHNGKIYRRFEFDSQLFRMSTISKSTNTQESMTQGSQDDFYIYSKGSPEHMLSIFDKQTVPKDYQRILKKYTCMGFRVLAIGHRLLKHNEIKGQRLQLQANLVFDGFEIFQNRLKPQTKDALTCLKEADLPFVMITGDNPLTASSIAYQCNINDPDKKSYICHYEDDHFTLQKFHQHQLQNYQEDQHHNFSLISELVDFIKSKDIQICLTGKAFNHLFENHFQINQQQSKQLLNYTKVFARAKPNDKARIISVYQSFGKIVAMCGDGANDCGALKQADIGLSLSQAQASISAPFTSQITNVSSMVQLIKQCRAGLATNYSLFNIMAMYSLIQYNSVVIIQFYYGFPGDFQYFYWDAVCNFAFFLTFGYTATSTKLTKQSPNCSLFTVSNITQLMVIFVIQLAGQLFMIKLLYDYADDIGYYDGITKQQFIEDDNQFVTNSYEGNILFMFTNFIYIMTLLAYSISKPWRKQFYTNIPFTIILILSLGLSAFLILFPEYRPQFMELDRIQHQPLLNLVLIISLGTGVFLYILQKFVMEPCFNKLKLRRPNSILV